MGAGKSWSPEKNLLACQAFIAASENSKKGNGQKKEKFEAAIEQEFKEHVETLQKQVPTFTTAGIRSGSSISQRFKVIRKACLNFHGIVQTIYNAKPTGSSWEGDVLNAATAVYNDLATVGDMYKYFSNSTLKVGKPFLFMNCYHWIKERYLWKMVLAANDSTTTNNKIATDSKKREKGGSASSEEGKESNESSSIITERRPIGAKRAASQMKQIAVLEKGAAGIAGLAGESKKRNEIAQKLLEVEKRNSRMSLFQMKGTSDDVRAKFLEIEQKRVLLEMKAEQEAIEKATKKQRTHEDKEPMSAAEVIEEN